MVRKKRRRRGIMKMMKMTVMRKPALTKRSVKLN